MPVNLNENSMQQFQNLPAHIQQRIADQSAMDRTGQYGGVFPASQAEQAADRFRSMTFDDAMYGGMDAALTVLGGAEKAFSPIQTLFPDISRPRDEFYGMSPEETQQGLDSHAASYYDMVGRVPDETVDRFDAVTNPLTLDRANYPQQGGPDPDSFNAFMRAFGSQVETPINLGMDALILKGLMKGRPIKSLLATVRKKMEKMKSKYAKKPDAKMELSLSPPKRSQEVGIIDPFKDKKEMAALRQRLAEAERRQIASKQQERTGYMPASHRRNRDRQQKQIDDLRRLTDGQD
jgi:hypothetical protein|tara:strand:- start:140 stop:1015 length:876 start_codon:yes stop_codon:yes gene_type:complete